MTNSEYVKCWYHKLTPKQKKARQQSASKRYHERYKEKASIHRKAKRDEARSLVFNHYGHKCDCCGEGHWEFLTVDHINGDGAAHRRSIKEQTIYIWLVKNNFPEGFRLLCFNCNCALGFRGHCPHQEKV